MIEILSSFNPTSDVSTPKLELNASETFINPQLPDPKTTLKCFHRYTTDLIDLNHALVMLLRLLSSLVVSQLKHVKSKA